MKVRKSILADVMGTLEAMKNNSTEWWEGRPNPNTTYIISTDSDGGDVLTINDVMLINDKDAMICAKLMAIVQRYGMSNDVQSLQSVKYAVGMWVAENNFDNNAISEAKEMIEMYNNSLKNNTSVIVKFDKKLNIYNE